MKLLLTSGGITNQSIKDALVGMLGKPIEESNALACSTASYPMQNGARMAFNFYSNTSHNQMTDLGWKSLGVLELTALPSIEASVWQDQLKNTDVLLVNGGDPLFLNHWMKTSGVADFLPNLRDLVYVGLSAGSMIMTPRIGPEFVDWKQPSGNDETLGFVNFSIFPHLDHPMLSENTMDAAVKWAAELSNPSYAIDEATAIRVIENQVDVISEGTWRKFST